MGAICVLFLLYLTSTPFKVPFICTSLVSYDFHQTETFTVFSLVTAGFPYATFWERTTINILDSSDPSLLTRWIVSLGALFPRSLSHPFPGTRSGQCLLCPTDAVCWAEITS